MLARCGLCLLAVVQAVLIMLPERFIHDVQTPTDVQNINKSATQISLTTVRTAGM